MQQCKLGGKNKKACLLASKQSTLALSQLLEQLHV
jgi:hypothetical protein